MNETIIKMSKDILELISLSGTSEDKLNRVIIYIENVLLNLPKK